MGRFDRERTPEEPPVPPWPARGEPVERSESGPLGRDGDLPGLGSSGPERTHQFRLQEPEMATLADIGTFRALALTDIARYRYGGQDDAALQALNRLARHGLIEYRTLSPGAGQYVTLTPKGRDSLKSLPGKTHADQRFYSGFVKPREARHDAALYRLYQQEATKITAANGRVTRVILDFELKRSINRRLSTIGELTPNEQVQRRQEIAAENGLKVVNGKIPIPDLRIEYEGPNQDQTKVDLELVTGHYHRGNLALKAQAGFAMYALPEDAVRLRPAMQDPEIMQDILSL